MIARFFIFKRYLLSNTLFSLSLFLIVLPYLSLMIIPYLLSTLTFICVFDTGTMRDVREMKAEARLNRHLARVIVLKAKSRSHDTFSFCWNSRGSMYNFLCFRSDDLKNLNLCISEYVLYIANKLLRRVRSCDYLSRNIFIGRLLSFILFQ